MFRMLGLALDSLDVLVPTKECIVCKDDVLESDYVSADMQAVHCAN